MIQIYAVQFAILHTQAMCSGVCATCKRKKKIFNDSR